MNCHETLAQVYSGNNLSKQELQKKATEPSKNLAYHRIVFGKISSLQRNATKAILRMGRNSNKRFCKFVQISGTHLMYYTPA